MSLPAGQWFVGGASVLGAAHRRRNMPNQDAILWLPESGPSPRFVAAVSDGHGAPAHFLSQYGSQFAVESVLSILSETLDGGIASETSPDLLAQTLAERTLAAWRTAALAHACALAPGDDWVEEADEKLLPYGATLLAVAASDDLTIALQIGDGDLLLGFADGRIERPLPDDVGLIGERTHSLCEIDAISHFRIAVFQGGENRARLTFAMLSTDGVSKSFADDEAFRAVVEHYRRALSTSEPATVIELLPAWLEEVSTRGSGDDATICLAVCGTP